MDDAERAFRDALHRVDSVKIPVPSLVPAEVRRGPGLGIMMAARWLAAAAVLAVVVGLGVLALSDRGGTVTAVPSTPPSSAVGPTLTGTTWMAVQLYGKPTKGAPDNVPFLEFAAGATFSGGDPCNGVGGTYRQSGTELRLAPGAMTEIGCGTDQQTLFHKALDNTRRAIVDDLGYLELLDQSGSVLAVFQSSGGSTYPEPTPTLVPTPAPTVDPDTPTGSLPTPVGSEVVTIRVHNASDVDFESVEISFSGQRMTFGPIAAGEASRFQRTEKANYYAPITVVTAEMTYRLEQKPSGAAPMTPGSYTYALNIVDGALSLATTTGR